MVFLRSNPTLTKTVVTKILIKLKLSRVVYASNPSQEAVVGSSQVQSQLGYTGRLVSKQIKCKNKPRDLAFNLMPQITFL